MQFFAHIYLNITRHLAKIAREVHLSTEIVAEYNRRHTDTAVVRENADEPDLSERKDSEVRMSGERITRTSDVLAERLGEYYYQW